MKIYLSSKGIRPDIDNATIINRALETAKEGSTIVWKDGISPISKTIIQTKKLHWEGTEDTTLKAEKPITLVKFMGGYKPVISRIKFKGQYSIWDGTAGDHLPGVQVSSLIRMVDCLISNVWGNGITCSADIHTGTGNASKSKFENIDIAECKGHGMYFQGGDANQCGVYDADIRDCNGVGICDSSFLGNQFYGCMTHNNKAGSYRADDGNNRTGFYGCYAEEGQGPIYLAGAACWFGGLPSQGIIVASPWARVFSYSSVLIKQP